MRLLVPMLLAACAVAPARAQQAEVPHGDERPSETTVFDDPAPAAAADRITVSARARIVNEYISRGIAFSDRPSLQPSLTVRLALPELTGGAITDVGVFVGSWNSIQFDSPGLGQPSSGALSGWYEADLYAGAAVKLDDRWTVSATYFRYESPGNSFRGYNDLELIVGFDDAALWRRGTGTSRFTLSPAIRMVQEAGRPGRKDALYIQPALTPTYRFGSASRPVRLAVPLVMGFSDHYYLNRAGGTERFGFFRTGVTLSGNPFPGGSGPVISGGFDIWLLNNKVANGLDSAEVVGRISISHSF